jgi:DNA-binding MarR family transcriptional regulator
MRAETAIHRLVRRLQQRNKVVGRSRDIEFSLAEVHVLVELDAAPGRGVGELATHLKVDQSFISRLVQTLARRKLVSVARESEDARKKRIVLTTAGRAVVRKLDERANLSYRAMLGRISRSDEARVVTLFRVISDGLGHPKVESRPSEASYRAEQRRLTRCCGLLGDTVFGSQVSAAVWQVLGEVVLAPVAPQPGELAVLLSVAQNSLSSIVTTMEHKKLLQRERSGRDGRAVVLRALPAGTKLYHEIEQRAEQLIRKAVAGVSAAEINGGVEVFRRFLGDSGEDVAPIAAGSKVIRVDSSDERALVRGLIARALVREGLEQHIPENFVVSSGECLELRTDDSVVAALELDLVTGMIRSCGWDESVSPWGLASFIGEALLRYPEMRRPFRRSCEGFKPLMVYLGLG